MFEKNSDMAEKKIFPAMAEIDPNTTLCQNCPSLFLLGFEDLEG